MPDPQNLDTQNPDPQNPDPRTARDDDEDATNEGVSSTDPAEGDDTDATDGSPGG